MRSTFSCVSYLNALPFVEGLRGLPEPERPRLLLDPPFVCAERLRRGEADVALLPSIEFASMPGAISAGDLGIASREEVRSVVLLSKIPCGELRMIAVDSNSRTSVALLKILLSRRYRSRPELVPMPPDPGTMLERCDAALLIGDAALDAPREGLHVLDLAAAWNDLTRLPFVFAIWAARNRRHAEEGGAVLTKALIHGTRALPGAIRRFSRDKYGSGRDLLRAYFEKNLHYRLGVDEKRSLELFFRLCREDGLLRPLPERGPAGSPDSFASALEDVRKS